MFFFRWNKQNIINCYSLFSPPQLKILIVTWTCVREFLNARENQVAFCLTKLFYTDVCCFPKAEISFDVKVYVALCVLKQ